MDADAKADHEIQQWKVRRLIKTLSEAEGAGTSLISLIVPPKDDIAKTNEMLAEEFGKACSIKSGASLSVVAAIVLAQHRLKRYSRTPNNGLILYCGDIINEVGKQKKVAIVFEPFRPINTALYRRGNKFHTEDLAALLESDDKFGFLVMDGSGALYGTLQGNHREVLHEFSVDLPKAHGRGGFEERHDFVRKVGELCTQMFITSDVPNIAGLVVAGSAEIKQDLTTSDIFDPVLEKVLIGPLLDVSYGGENGFNQAIELAGETLKNVKFIQEKRLITSFLDEVAQDTGKCCFGIMDTITGLEMGAVSTLIVWEQLEIKRLQIKNPHTDVESIHFVTPEAAKSEKPYRDAETGVELDVVHSMLFVEWIVENYKTFGTKLEFITDRSQEGNQFCKGFGGVGGLMRYRVEFP